MIRTQRGNFQSGPLKKVFYRSVEDKCGIYLLLGVVIFCLIDYIYIYSEQDIAKCYFYVLILINNNRVVTR